MYALVPAADQMPPRQALVIALVEMLVKVR